jgi:hypothetical protein
VEGSRRKVSSKMIDGFELSQWTCDVDMAAAAARKGARNVTEGALTKRATDICDAQCSTSCTTSKCVGFTPASTRRARSREF